MMRHPIERVEAIRIVAPHQTLISIPSITNQEYQIADPAYEQLKSVGLSGGQKLAVESASDTAIGWIDGPAHVRALLFNFHFRAIAARDGWHTDPLALFRQDWSARWPATS